MRITKFLPLIAVALFLTSCVKEEPVSSSDDLVYMSDLDAEAFHAGVFVPEPTVDPLIIQYKGETKRSGTATMSFNWGGIVENVTYYWKNDSGVWEYQGAPPAQYVLFGLPGLGDLESCPSIGLMQWKLVVGGSGCTAVQTKFFDSDGCLVDTDSYSIKRGRTYYFRSYTTSYNGACPSESGSLWGTCTGFNSTTCSPGT